MNGNINVLYVSFSFPPINAAASFRATKITNYLHEHGIEATVLTKSISRESHIHRSTQLGLLRNISKKTRVLRARFFSPTIFHLPFKILRLVKHVLSGRKKDEPAFSFTLLGKLPRDPFIPDHYIEWLPFAFRKAVASVERENVDLIYATGPPFSVHLLGYLLKAKLGKPLILEYRDPWTDDPYQEKIAIKERINETLERFLLEHADGVVCIAEPLKINLIKKFHMKASEAKFTVIPSAFDPIDFKDLPKVGINGSDSFIITITTTLYGGRNPEGFFKAISMLKNKGILENVDFQVHVYGYNDEARFSDLLQSLEIDDIVFFKGLVPHDTCISIMKASTINLDVGEADFDYPTLPYHFWEYLGSGKKILFYGNPDSYKAGYIKHHDLGMILPANDVEKTANMLEQLVQDFKEGTLSSSLPPGTSEKQTWKNRLLDLSRYLKKIAKASMRE